GVSGRGLPRAKRWVYDSGTRVPLIVRVPEKWRKTAMPGNPDALKPGSACDELIASVDFAPTVLSLAGVEIPKRMQGRAFLGRQKGKPREYVYGARDRTDEAYDLIRTVRDGRFRYVRNYMWHVPRSQAIACVEQMPTMQEMRRLHAEGKLQGPPTQYFEPAKPVEELYDTAADPHEVNNLASDPKWQETLVRMRQAHQEWRRGTMDIGLIPEPLFDEMKRPGGQIEKTADPVFVKFSGGKEGGTAAIACATLGASVVWRIGGDPKQESGWNLYVRPVPIQPGETLHAQACRLGFHDSGVVAFKIGDAIVDKPEPIHADHWADKSDLAGQRQRLVKIKDLDFKGPNATTEFLAHLQDPKPAVRYWAVVGLHVWTKYSVDLAMAKPAVTTMLEDPSMVVRVAAAHAMCDWGEERIGLPILAEALKNSSDKTRMLAMVALDSIGGMARPVLPQIQAAAQDSDEYVALVAGAVVSGLDRK
ncbi:MAG: sulfatase/phosphatase domain-containing protein, partial [Solirubrobacterales bacterium]